MATTEQSQQGHERSTDKQEYPFSAVLSEDGVEEIDMIHRHISGLIDEYRLHITENGWEIRVVDASNVWIADIRIPTTVFEQYDCSEDMKVGVNVDEWNDAIQNDSGQITYGFDTSGDPQLSVGDTSVTTIDPDSIRMEPDVSNLELDTTAVVEDIELFTHFCNNTGSHIQISGSDEGIALHCEKDVSNDTLLLPDDNGSDVREYTRDGYSGSLHDRVADMHESYETNEHLRSGIDVSLFSQDYLENAFKNLLVKHKRGVSYELELGTEFPLKLHRRDDTDVEFTFMLAPRIQ